MPRLSLYRPEKSQDYKFMDRTIYEMFQVGGVDVYVHKYIGTLDGDLVKDVTQIQDLIFLENRDRKYDADIYVLRGHYQTQDIDFNLSQFGLFLQNDTVFLTIHINNSVDLLGRKIMSGDVVELPNLKDEYALNDFKTALKRFYVVEDVNRAAEGFSATWYPHLYRIKLKPIVDSQEFKDILDRPENTDNYAGDYDSTQTYYAGQVVKYKGDLYQVKDTVVGGTSVSPPDTTYWQEYGDNTLRDIMSTYEKEMQINAGIVAEAEIDAPMSGFETRHFYTLAVDTNGNQTVETVDITTETVSEADNYISDIQSPPIRDGYKGYLLEDGYPPNGPINLTETAQFGFGIQFPTGAVVGDTFLRTDYLPNRMFRFDGTRWVKQEDKVRMTFGKAKRDPITNEVVGLDDYDFDVTRQTLKTSFINNTEMSGISKIATDVVTIDSNGYPIWNGGTIYDNTKLYIINDIVLYNSFSYKAIKDTVAGTIPTDTEYWEQLVKTTVSFTLTGSSAFILTNVTYDATYKVDAWLDEDGHVTDITTSNASGFLAFTINRAIADGTRIRYSVYDVVVQQRQSVSKALKFKPTADN